MGRYIQDKVNFDDTPEGKQAIKFFENFGRFAPLSLYLVILIFSCNVSLVQKIIVLISFIIFLIYFQFNFYTKVYNYDKTNFRSLCSLLKDTILHWHDLVTIGLIITTCYFIILPVQIYCAVLGLIGIFLQILIQKYVNFSGNGVIFASSNYINLANNIGGNVSNIGSFLIGLSIILQAFNEPVSIILK